MTEQFNAPFVFNHVEDCWGVAICAECDLCLGCVDEHDEACESGARRKEGTK